MAAALRSRSCSLTGPHHASLTTTGLAMPSFSNHFKNFRRIPPYLQSQDAYVPEEAVLYVGWLRGCFSLLRILLVEAPHSRTKKAQLQNAVMQSP